MTTMVRVSAFVRDTIVKNLLAKKYLAEDTELDRLKQLETDTEKEQQKLCYEAAFNAATRKLLTEAAPGMFVTANSVRLRIEKGPDNYFDALYGFDGEKPIPFRNHQWGGSNFAAVVPADSPFYKAFEAHKAASVECNNYAKELRDKKAADRQRILRVVESVTTIKRLLEVWPEVRDFLPEENSGAGGSLPAEIISDLNKNFGL